MTEVANTSAATRNRLIVYVATDDPTITARATQIDDAERTTIAVSVRERTDTPTIAFLQAFASASSIAPPSDSDLVCRIDYRLADLDEVDRRIVRSFAHSLLDSDYLDTAVAAITETPQIGLATPAGLPRIALERAGDDTLVPRLAKQLGLPLQAFADTFFFPQPMHFLRGGLYNALAQRHANATASDEQALALGFHALCKASGLASTDLSPKPQVADADDLRRHEAQVLARATKRGRHAEFRPRVRRDDLPAQPSLKVIAYYLPQFHAIPENDHWWGTGFTEWTNVSKAVPRFIGHEQPRFPTDLGYYDLNRPEIMAHQIELARSHGVHGFCFYYYWFNGRTLLERPLENFLADASLDMPFCLCWANENWTRRWDGQEDEVLMAQSHSPRDDLRFIEHIAPYLRDARYIRVDGKPLLLVYRASLLDDARATAQRWRQWCRDNDIGEICLAAVCSFDIDDPRPFGFDVAVEFPPHQLRNMPPINPSLTFIDRAFAGEVLDYRETVLLSALGKYPETAKPFPMLHGVMTGWDNDARRNGRGRVFHHASPSAYANWLRLAASHTHRHNPPELQYVFVNAWNEWAEGAYLEPDRRFGHAHLAATADTLRTVEPRRDIPPPELGSSSGALAHLPDHLLRRHGAAESSLCRTRIQASGKAPRLRVTILVDALTPSLLDTLQSLAEQTLDSFAVSIVSRHAGPRENWLDHAGIGVECLITDPPLAGLNELAQRHDDDWLILLNAGDRLFPHALLAIAAELCTNAEACVLLSDELEHDGDPAISRARWRTAPTPTRLMCGPRDGGVLGVRRESFVALGGFDPQRAGATETDFLLRTAERAGWGAIRHLPEVLVWRSLAQHVDAGAPDIRQLEQRVAAAAAHLARCSIDADVSILDGDALRIQPKRAAPPKVSIIVTTHDQPEALQRCIESVFANTDYPNYEVIVVDHDNTEPTARSFLDGLAGLDPARIRVLPASGPFEHARFVNLAAVEARGEYLLLLDDDTAPLHAEWLDAMIDEAASADVGIVGARLVFPDGRLQHAGVVPGMSGAADFPWSGRPLDDAGPDGVLLHAREVPAVSGSCMLIRRELFARLNGFDTAYGAGFGDFDFCLRARQTGARVVWSPHAALMHESGRTLKAAMRDTQTADRLQQRFDEGRREFLARWRKQIAAEPLYNPNLSLASRNVVVESHPALARDPIDWHPLPSVFALPADDAGSGHYRVGQPARAAHARTAARTRVAVSYPMPLLFDRLGIDTLHTQRQVDDAQLTALEHLRSGAAPRIVMDFDDLLTEIPKHSHHAAQVWPDIERRMRRACELSDCITVSTAALAERLRAWHDDVRVIPNGIDPALWQPTHEPGTRHGKLRVGWAGGLSHAGDLALIRKVVETLADEVEWVFLGMCLQDMQPHLTEFHHGVPFGEYPDKLAALGLDLAIAPLEANAFNECKSNLRLLEYGALGTPVIASDQLPYRCGLPVQRVDNRPHSWIAAIRERIGERQTLAADGARLREAVLADWTVDRFLPDWLDAWRG